ncbi:similar to Saccharomyces cerevisiae YBR246W RRT2 Putative protein of unknown function [Maudiozyma saulgeensis]|uniref:methylated diphthine methylhydrolase n=1 Tax=Maudiozyma saulgeensis TaxID=1789683 RepID=A0A1X7RAU1_9SACH|nr:similar to Saccharomyces cerevisiae YBR246W RRT2 Putative protein of unknown function [Kazachstania saulgeensis]
MEITQVTNQVNTELPPCCLRIFRDKFVLVGTYELDKPTGNRTGSIDVYDTNLKRLHIFPTYGAILDLKLSPFDDTLLATAHSTGNVMLWKIVTDDGNNDLTIELISNLFAFENDTLITSLHFSPLDPKLVCVTTTTGECATFDMETNEQTFNVNIVKDIYSKIDTKTVSVQGMEESGRDILVETFTELHGLECWTAEFGQLSPLQDVLFTGGDDSTIMAHDLRSKENIWSNGRIHEAGVVGIKCSSKTFRHSRPTSIITGSYDDHIRNLDLRMLGDSIYPGRNTPVSQLTSKNLGGGVWRFSETPTSLKTDSVDRLMVCCMYDGAKIVTLDESNKDSEEYFNVDKFLIKGHKSMCYGGDWGNDFIATCSFYDKSLQKWSP